MKKIAIITLFGNTNYGNRLQNYAVQTIFEKKGFKVDTLDFYLSKSRKVKAVLKNGLSLLSRKPVTKRDRLLKEFNKKYIHVRSVSAPGGEMPSALKKEYGFFAVGSDQVWNPEIRKNQRDILFLEFADREQRIAVSPSIGVSRIEDIYVDDLKRRLNGFPHLSCREKAGSQEIERITGRTCKHLIDPTLVLSADEWRKAAATERTVSEQPYALLFFLGQISSDLREKISTFCAKENLEMKIMEGSNFNFSPVSPFGFVNLIDNAQMVFTDSFHGTAFSVNLETPFYAFNRIGSSSVNTKTSSRIESLLGLFNLDDRFNAAAFTQTCDFSYARTRLVERRDEFTGFLDLSMGTTHEEV